MKTASMNKLENTDNASPIFITREQLSKRWQISPMSLKRYEIRGMIKPLKIAPRVLRYRLADIEAFEMSATQDRKESN
jgi:hypothetical protein